MRQPRAVAPDGRARLARLAAAASGLALTPALAGAQAQAPVDLIRPAYSEIDERGVDLLDGSFTWTRVDLTIGPAVGKGGLAHGETFRGATRRDLMTVSISNDGNDLRFVTAGDRSDIFARQGAGWVSALGRGSMLSGPDPSLRWTYTADDGTVTRLAEIPSPSASDTLRPNGDQTMFHWLVQTYTAGATCVPDEDPTAPPCKPGLTNIARRLQAISTNRGYAIKFAYATDTLDASSAQSWARRVSATSLNMGQATCDLNSNASCETATGARTVRYAYATEAGGVTREDVTDPEGQITSYRFDAQKRLISVTPSVGDPFVAVGYRPNGTVGEVGGRGGTVVYNYTDLGDGRASITATDSSTDRRRTIVSEPVAGGAARRVEQSVDGVGRSTRFEHDAQGRVSAVTRPGGDRFRFSYDDRGNVIKQEHLGATGGAITVAEAIYPPDCPTGPIICNKPTITKNHRGGQTSYEWSPVHGGLLSATGPTGARTWSTYATLAAPFAPAVAPPGTVTPSPSITLPETVSACVRGQGCAGTGDESRTTVTYATGAAGNLNPASIAHGSGTSPSIATTSFTWTEAGDVETVDGPLAGAQDRSWAQYDRLRRVTGLIGPDPDGAGAQLHLAEQRFSAPTACSGRSTAAPRPGRAPRRSPA